MRTWVCNLQHTSSYLRPDDMEVDTNEPEHLVQEIHDKTVVSHCRLHRPPFMCIYPRQRLRDDIPVDVGHMAPVTPPALLGIWRGDVLVWPLPATPMSPRTPEAPPPTTPTEAFLPGTPPGHPH